jgi:hypothetical protein
VCYACHLAFTLGRQEVNGVAPDEVAYMETGPQPVLAAVAQISGHYLAMETIRLLTGLEALTAGRELNRYFLDYDKHYYLETEPRPDCPVACATLLP